MAKISVVIRQKRREQLFVKYRDKRKQLKKTIVNLNVSQDERSDAERELQSLPRDSSPCRQRNRCNMCGRPRSYNRLTGLCRLHLRTAVMHGMVPGMRKASW